MFCNASFAEKIKLTCKLTPGTQVDIQKKFGLKDGGNVVEWYLHPKMPFAEGGNAYEAASAYFGTQGNKHILLAFSDVFKITYRGNWFFDGRPEMTAFWVINRFTGKANFFAYKMPWDDWEKAMKFLGEKYPDKLGKPNWDWIYDVRTRFVEPNYDLFYKRMDFDCKKLEETKF